MEASSEKTTCSEDFSKLKVDKLENYLRERGIQLSDGGKGKQKAELLDLCQKAAAMKQRKLDDSVKDRTKLLKDKLQTSEGKLSDPNTKTKSAWTHNFSKIPEFTFGDLYNYLVGNRKEDYSPENLCSFKSFLGFRLFRDGQVQLSVFLCYHRLIVYLSLANNFSIHRPLISRNLHCMLFFHSKPPCLMGCNALSLDLVS
ncbi:hypothetical protein ACROYT_G041850, partial [Oculina patagonica]